ncbi:MAG: hypothetical protein KKB70_01385 [Proteobacteria bacterium]|nr:hypothetical protein [Pseudomonadota bacterium]MBU1612224.1 hypothetical protein [Pseudomonadota bacterium]
MPEKKLPMAFGGCGCNEEEAAVCGCRDAAEERGLEMIRKAPDDAVSPAELAKSKQDDKGC